VEAYDQVAAAMQQGELAPEVEDRIEDAHLEVVRRQRDVERRFRPGVLGASALAVAALLAGQTISVPLGVVALIASVAMAAWLLVVPRRSLAAAQAVEDEALAQADAGSWLGLHLRRLDAVEDVPERERFEEVANARAAAQVDWDEVAAGLDPADLAIRADAVRAHADAIDPQAIARRLEEARAFSAAAHEAEAAARTSLTSGLDAYGVTIGGGADLDPYQLATILNRRIEAGAVARRAKKLAILEQREAEAGRKLGDVLTHLGYTDGDLDSRLARAVAAVAAAKHRQEAGTRSRADIEQEVAVLERRVQDEAQQGWAEEPDPSSAPTDPLLLEARRREIGELVNAAGRPDVVGAERRCDVALSRVNDLEARLAELANGPGSLQQRLISRLGRTTWSGDHEESVPVFVDEALVAVPVAERMDLLDLVVRLTEHVQVVLLTADPVVARWARDRAMHDKVTLYEAQPTVDASDPGPVVEAAARAAELDGVPFEGFRGSPPPPPPPPPPVPTLVHAPLR
ncbi:MAG TPA: hypothetical protein VHK88_09295, partial [Aquihabitans sp.]|nr:hypothetical protein [Aquihabitans sp.]